MKTGKYHIIVSRILLICFIAGQFMVYAHQHNASKKTAKIYTVSKNTPRQTVTEKCSLCDVMHHNAMVTGSQPAISLVLATSHIYKAHKHDFISIGLILSGGRAPPICIYQS